MNLAMLIDAGAIPIGSEIRPISPNYRPYYALIESDPGKSPVILLSNGETFTSLSTAAGRVIGLATGKPHAQNGWAFWRLAGDGRTLGEIRDEYESRQGTPAGYVAPGSRPVSRPGFATGAKTGVGLKADASSRDGSRSSGSRPVYPFQTGNGAAFAGGGFSVAQKAFWSEFYDYCANNPDFCNEFGKVPSRVPPKDGCVSFDVKSNNYKLDVIADTQGNSIGVSVWFTNPEAFRQFYRRKAAIQNELQANNVELLWGEIGGGNRTGYLVAKKAVDFNKGNRKNMCQWIDTWLEKLNSVAQNYRKWHEGTK